MSFISKYDKEPIRIYAELVKIVDDLECTYGRDIALILKSFGTTKEKVMEGDISRSQFVSLKNFYRQELTFEENEIFDPGRISKINPEFLEKKQYESTKLLTK